MALQIHGFVIETIQVFVPVLEQIERRDRNLGDQMRRALASVALNLNEGVGNQRGNRRLRFETARGSAKESLAAYEVAAAFGYVRLDAGLVDRLDRIAATMYRLGRPAS